MAWSEFQKRIKRQVADFLEIPSDVMLNLPKIVLVGNVYANIIVTPLRGKR